MMGDAIDDLRALQSHRADERARRRAHALLVADTAAELAALGGCRLARFSAVHYALTVPAGWRLDFYPGNRRVVRHKAAGRPSAPFVPLKAKLLELGLLGFVAGVLAFLEAEAAEEEGGDQKAAP